MYGVCISLGQFTSKDELWKTVSMSICLCRCSGEAAAKTRLALHIPSSLCASPSLLHPHPFHASARQVYHKAACMHACKGTAIIQSAVISAQHSRPLLGGLLASCSICSDCKSMSSYLKVQVSFCIHGHVSTSYSAYLMHCQVCACLLQVTGYLVLINIITGGAAIIPAMLIAPTTARHEAKQLMYRTTQVSCNVPPVPLPHPPPPVPVSKSTPPPRPPTTPGL